MENQMKATITEGVMKGVAQAAASEWQWCGQCERASISKIAYNCGYEGCEANIESVYTWKYIRRCDPDFPEIPVRDVVYALRKKS